MEYYHAFTKGLETDVLFRDNADFVYGMNLVPRCLKATGTKLLAFCLMDNHVHFVIGGPRDRCNLFHMDSTWRKTGQNGSKQL